MQVNGIHLLPLTSLGLGLLIACSGGNDKGGTEKLSNNSAATGSPIIVTNAQGAVPTLKRCVRSPLSHDPSAANSFEDRSECDLTDGTNLAVPIQAEIYPGQSCVGPKSQSLPIDRSGQPAPTTLQWIGNRGAWTMNLKQDYVNFDHACGVGAATWYGLMRHTGIGGGNLPKPANLVHSVVFNYAQEVSRAEARLIASFEGVWNGRAHLVEINLISKWTPQPGRPADVVYLDPGATFSQYGTYLALNAAAFSANLIQGRVSENMVLRVTLAWGPILQHLVGRGLLPAPTDGWDQAQTQAVFLGTEIHNKESRPSGSTNLYIASFDVLDDGNLGSAPPCQPQAAGLFRVGGAIYFSNGTDAFCPFQSWDDLLRFRGGNGDLSGVVTLAGEPSCMRKDGFCAVPPPPSPPPCQPQPRGFFRIGEAIHYSNGTDAFCWIRSWSDFLKINAGNGDTSGIPSLSAKPACMRDDGGCNI